MKGPQELRLSFVTARNFFGIDINPFAVELAKVTLMIGRKLAEDELHLGEHPQATVGEVGVGIRVSPSTHAKCERCWHYREDVGADGAHPTLCGRCVSNLFGEGEA